MMLSRSRHPLFQQLREVLRLYRRAAAVQSSGKMQQATHVTTDEAVGVRGFDGGELAIHHASGNFRILYREKAAESTTLLGFAKLDQFDAGDSAKNFSRLFAHAQAARQVAGSVVGNFAASPRADFLHAKNIDQEAGELAAALGDRMGFGEPFRVIFKKHFVL